MGTMSLVKKVKDPVRVYLKSRGRQTTPEAKVMTQGSRYVGSRAMLERITNAIESGYEARIGDEEGGIRGILLFSARDKKLHFSGQAYGDFNMHIKSLDYGVDKTSKISMDEYDERRERGCERKRVESVRANVTPDTVVRCPNCGTEFRVGKQLV